MRERSVDLPRPRNVYACASSRGVAFEIARQLAMGGDNVALSSRSAEHLDRARAAIQAVAPHARIETVVTDLSWVDGQARALDRLEALGFVPDILVCGAGHPQNRRLSLLTRSSWQNDLEMILGQAVFASQRLVPLMARSGFGRLVFLSSIYAKAPEPDYFMSSLARSGLFALSKTICEEYGCRGVSSFVICLGFIDTPMVRNLALGRKPDAPEPTPVDADSWREKYEEWAGRIPVRRLASPTELAKFVEFLLSPEAEYLNGNVFSFSGGLDRSIV